METITGDRLRQRRGVDMFNNDFSIIEELVAGGSDIDGILDNLPERFGALVTPPLRSAAVFKQSRVDSLVWAYRDIGYLYADINPLGESYKKEFTRFPEFQEGSYHRLTLEEFGLSEGDLDAEFFGGGYISGGYIPLREIIQRLRQTYCGYIGVEFLHIQNRTMREWLLRRMESTGNRTELSGNQKRTIMLDLMKTEELENMLHRTFLGQTRFSIQGADVVIPALHFLVDNAHRYGVEEIVMGTSHRGRLSMLNIILNQSPEEIFYLFEENFVPGIAGGSGDVRYHVGYCTIHDNDDGSSVNITMLPNSSQLESVDAVVEGNARGLQDLRNDTERKHVMPLVIHGDASFAAQGVVAETFNLSGLPGYTTGGTIHIVINNQIGFTTPAIRGHSGLNPTDIAKMLPIPVLHVNGDVPEAVVHAVSVAMDFRQVFGSDVVVDIYCYRRYGHNEGDEPSYTQPVMYSLIKDHPSVTSLFLLQCLAEGVLTRQEYDAARSEYHASLSAALDTERHRLPVEKEDVPRKDAANRIEDASTAIDERVAMSIADAVSTMPPDFAMHQRLRKIIDDNHASLQHDRMVGWSMAESMAFGSLLIEGVPVRISGQDSERGTFSQRHLVWWESEKADCCSYLPLANLGKDQAPFQVSNSPLSEFSVLAFEYGYSIARQDSLVIWEAQYGDFANGAQIIIDNYISAGRSKWNIKNGLVLLLPHGYEGMGPEHSSGHLERFLQLCSQDNMRVCNVTMPAQYFHLLRLQKKARRTMPLVIMTPKSLLRHPLSRSPLRDIVEGHFHPILVDAGAGTAERIIFCSGKIYYDLMGAMTEANRSANVIVRVEQLYPFPDHEIAEVFDRYRNAPKCSWVQEEPKNRGPWRYMHERFEEIFPGRSLVYIGRDSSASPATSSLKQHKQEQARIIAAALE